jgi:hypothetical protein
MQAYMQCKKEVECVCLVVCCVQEIARQLCVSHAMYKNILYVLPGAIILNSYYVLFLPFLIVKNLLC